MSSPSPGPPSSGAGSAEQSSSLYDLQGSALSSSELVQTLWNGKWLILGLALLGGSLAYAHWQQQPKQYRTSSVLLLGKSKQLNRLDLSLPTKSPSDIDRGLYFLRHSQAFATRVARRLADSIATPATKSSTPFHTDDGDLPSISALASRIRRTVRVRRGSREVPAIKISVTSPHPAEATLITNIYAQAYLDHLRESSNARQRTSQKFLERQKQQLKRRLRSIEDTIAAYVREQGRAGLLAAGDSSGGPGVVGQARQIASEISDLRIQKEKIQLELDVEQAMLDTAKARLNHIRPNLTERASSNTGKRLKQTQQNIASLQRRIQQIQVQNEDLTGDLRSELERMKTRVEALQKKSHRLADRYVQEALSTDAVNPMGDGSGGLSTVVDLKRQITDHRIAITKLKARRSALVDRIEARKAALREAPDQTLARLKRRRQTTEELFVALSKSLQKIRVSAESTPQQAQILQRAQRPSHPIGPDVKRNVILALLLGGAVGAGLVVVYARSDDRMEEPESIEQLGIGVFGVVPTWSGTDEVNTEGDAAPPETHSGVPTRPWTGIAPPCSPAAEAYRHVATNLRLGLPASPDILLLTSPNPREGKSLTAANLSVALSEAGRDVLLIDADCHGATLHRPFGCDRAPGLTDRLAESTEAVQTILASHDNLAPASGDGAPPSPPRRGRLGLLPSGTEVPQPSLLLQEDHVHSLLQQLQTSWDLVLLDTPPILSYDTASRLAALSDMALLVGSAGDTSHEAYAESVEQLTSLCPGPVAGLLNRYDASTEVVYGYGYSTYESPSDDASPVRRMVEHTKRGFRRLATGR